MSKKDIPKLRFQRWKEICKKADTWEKKQKSIDVHFFNEVNTLGRHSGAFSDTKSSPQETLSMWRNCFAKENLFLLRHKMDANFIAYNVLKCQQHSRCGLVVDYNVYCLVKDSFNSGMKVTCEDFRRLYFRVAIEYVWNDNLQSYDHMSDEIFTLVQANREILRDSQYLSYFVDNPNNLFEGNLGTKKKTTSKTIIYQMIINKWMY
jgi:hypothetical protein